MSAAAQPRLVQALGHTAGRYGHVMFPENVHEPALEVGSGLVGLGMCLWLVALEAWCLLGAGGLRWKRRPLLGGADVRWMRGCFWGRVVCAGGEALAGSCWLAWRQGGCWVLSGRSCASQANTGRTLLHSPSKLSPPPKISLMPPPPPPLPPLQLAKRLLGTVGAGWASRVFYTDDGSTAVEVALKMAFRKFMSDQGLLEEGGPELQVGLLGEEGVGSEGGREGEGARGAAVEGWKLVCV